MIDRLYVELKGLNVVRNVIYGVMTVGGNNLLYDFSEFVDLSCFTEWTALLALECDDDIGLDLNVILI